MSTPIPVITLATILAAQAESARITDDQYGDADRIAAWQERAR